MGLDFSNPRLITLQTYQTRVLLGSLLRFRAVTLVAGSQPVGSNRQVPIDYEQNYREFAYS